MRAAEAAKTIRGDLKRAFPDTKFSVRSSNFSQGHSVDVNYTDGPPLDAVEAIANHYGQRGFSGSDDSTYFVKGDHAALTSEGIIAKTYRGFVHVSRTLSQDALVAVGFDISRPRWDDNQPRPFSYNKIDLRDLATVPAQMEAQNA